MALLRKYRITRDKDFDRAFRSGKTIPGKYITLKVIPNGLDRIRFGVAVSAKKFPLAVVRNRIKRMVFFQAAATQTSTKAGFDVVVVAQADHKETGSDLGVLMKKITTGTK